MRQLGLITIMIGCGGSGDGGIQIFAPDAALLVAQDGDGPWLKVPLDGEGRGHFESTAGYHGIARLCPVSVLGGMTLPNTVFVRLETDLDPVELLCTDTLETTQLAGAVTPGADVFVGIDQANVSGSTYSAVVTPGTYDAAAVIPGERMLIVRDVDLSIDRDLDLDVGNTGVDLVELTPTVLDADPATVFISADMTTKGGTYVPFHAGSPPAKVPPLSALLEGDHAAVAASAGNCTAQLPLAATVTLQVPTPLIGRVDRTGAQFEADARVAWEGIRLSIRDRERISVVAQMSWLQAHDDPGVLPVVDPATFEGWTPELGGFIAAGVEVTGTVTLFRGAFDGDYTVCSETASFLW